ncbi:hypothetical protein SAMN05660299_01139 [Megasphaera paucivorans]|uniref:Uncharacterized protein n=1 Tax=Megasphaera paucivorans TaxID=349095 RepID=A0A1G9UBN5_9FIRM|nr:hypothetical protein SAMN05660299_01139 [Megasphaera paucivorans]
MAGLSGLLFAKGVKGVHYGHHAAEKIQGVHNGHLVTENIGGPLWTPAEERGISDGGCS